MSEWRPQRVVFKRLENWDMFIYHMKTQKSSYWPEGTHQRPAHTRVWRKPRSHKTSVLHFDGRCVGGETLVLNYFGITEKTCTEAGVKHPHLLMRQDHCAFTLMVAIRIWTNPVAWLKSGFFYVFSRVIVLNQAQQSLETFSVVIPGKRSGILLSTPQCTRQPPQQRTTHPKSTMLL